MKILRDRLVRVCRCGRRIWRRAPGALV